MTLTILAHEPASGSLGLCSITSSAAHGQRCPHHRQGVGIATTQGSANRYHGETALALLELGLTPDECIQISRSHDINIEYRQIGIIRSDGLKSAFTGNATKEHAGHIVGTDFVAIGNYLASRAVLEAVGNSYSGSSATFPERLLEACAAGERVGGESEGSVSGVLLVERPDQIPAWGAHVDIRIDYSPNVLSALRQALEHYRKWQEPRLSDQTYTLDGSLPKAALREPS